MKLSTIFSVAALSVSALMLTGCEPDVPVSPYQGTFQNESGQTQYVITTTSDQDLALIFNEKKGDQWISRDGGLVKVNGNKLQAAQSHQELLEIVSPDELKVIFNGDTLHRVTEDKK